MGYQIQSGDCLYNIVQQQYGLTNEADIAKKIDEVAKANGIENPDLIFAGETIELPGDAFSSENAQNQGNANGADGLDNWLQNKGADGSEYQMVEMNPETYHQDVQNFSQSYIGKYDQDGDGNLNEQEFTNMMSAGVELTDEQKATVQKVFTNMNLDNDGANISSSELASQFIMADFDSEKAKQTGKFSDGLDGKFNFDQFKQSFSNLANDETAGNAVKQKQTIYQSLYGQQNQEPAQSQEPQQQQQPQQPQFKLKFQQV